MIQSLNPATGQVLRRFEALTPEAIQSKLEIASGAAKTFAAETLQHRLFWMRRLALLLESDREELAMLLVTEVGKTISAARLEVDKCVAVCRFYAEHAERILEPEPIETGHAQSYVRWDPLGVVLAIMPWNFPLWQVFRFLAPALMAGNVCLLKHAPNVPQCALTLEALVRRAGFPRGTLQSLLIEATQVESVLADKRVAAVTLTGSEAAGRAVGAQAGYLLKKSVLELGGSDPFIVLPSADLNAAIHHAVLARCINNGQSCIAAKRFIVHTDVYEAFEKGFVARMRALIVGDPAQEKTQLGPLATEKGLEAIERQTNEAVAAGGKLLTGGKRLDVAGFYFEPTVISGVPRTAPVYAEETFGPLAMLFKVSSMEEAIEVANDTPFGLGASCWTKNAAEQGQLTARIEAGCVFFNTPVASDPRLPFGGIKQSGYGRELSAAGMREFLNAKTVIVAEPSDTPHQTDFTFADPEPSEAEGAEPKQDTSSVTVTYDAVVASAPASTEKQEPEPAKNSVLGLSSK